ncbi:hypothetical protein [Streptomyces sp. NPDC087294]|uniref:hypothetical protein n=1 Tax=Streptomyces sp. NPDC087294 TaxID=3365777 RepID=UPI00382992C9
MTDPKESDLPEEGSGSSPAPSPHRRRAARLAGGLLLGLVVLVGVGATLVAVREADRDAGVAVWTFPSDPPVEANAASAHGLGALLVPFGTDGWTRGPDVQEFGNDTELTGTEAQALRKKELSVLPRSQRRLLEKEYDKHPVKGMALRSYLSGEPHALDTNAGIYTVSLTVTRMASRAHAEELSSTSIRLLDALDLRKGPQVKGYKDARCFFASVDFDADRNGDIERLVCSAHQGDVLVTANAAGVAPLDGKGVAMLLAGQLDRIAAPGEAV